MVRPIRISSDGFICVTKTVHLVKTEKPQRYLNFAPFIGASSALASRGDSRSFKQEMVET